MSMRPQEPKPPFPYIVEDLIFNNVEENVSLAGTLTLPKTEGPFPVVILIAGSGDVDRDEACFGHKPFLVLADHLTRNGIAVLRYDKRGCGLSTGDYHKATSFDFANDVLAGIDYLKSRKDFNFTQIGLVGHSEGGIIAPIVAAQSNAVSFIVMMAGTGVNGEEILYEQGALQQLANGESEEAIHQNHKFQEKIFSVVKKENDPQTSADLVLNFVKQLPQTLDKQTLKALEARIARISKNIEWFRNFLTYDPTLNLKRLKVPTLVINGSLDLQVSPKQNLPVISKALEEAGNKDFTIVELPMLNHFFQTCETGAISEYEKIDETIAPSALDIITDWILERTSKD